MVEMGRIANHQLIQKSTHAVDVSPFVVTKPLQYLWTHVLGGATERVGSFLLGQDLAESKVGYLDVPVNIDEDVLRLDVPINDVKVVDVLHALYQLREIELGLLFGELLYFS